MNIDVEQQGEVEVLKLEGRLDANTSKELEEKLLPLVNRQGSRVLVDCASMGYISSAGLRVFLMAAKKAKRADGRIVLTGLSENVMEVFDISGFSALFTIRGTAEQGLEALN